MKSVFDLLREELESVDRWLVIYLTSPLTAKVRKMAMSLQRYVAHVYRDKKKWRSESEAEEAMIKVRRVWFALYSPRLRRD